MRWDSMGGPSAAWPAAAAILNLGNHTIADDPAHKVDGSISPPPKVQRVGISSRPSNGSAYGAGEEIVVWVEFTVPIAATGNPQLALRVGRRTRQAGFFGPSTNGTALFFRYRVQAEDLDTNGISIMASALTLNRGSISSETGTAAILDLGAHAIGDDPTHKVDGGG